MAARKKKKLLARRKKKPTRKKRTAKKAKKKTVVKRVKKNPARPGREAKVQEAIARFTGFRGDPPESIESINIQPIDPVMLTMGQCLGIMYETVRDGKKEKYIHQFKKSAQPLLCVSSDGLQLYLIGGSYSVTDRGIEDA